MDRKSMHKDVRGWVLKSLLIFIAMSWLALVAAAWAEAAEEEYNFSWLDPEKKIYVLQNRKYLKANHLLLSATVGAGFSNPYRSTYNLDPRLSFFFTEWLGIELFYGMTSNSNNSAFQALAGTGPSIFPITREINARMGALAMWVPWYSKINVFNKILYFDWYFTGGAGQINSKTTSLATPSQFTDQSLFAMYFGSGHLFHLSQSFLVRLDFTATVFSAPLFGTTGANNWYTDYNFGAGLGWKI